MGRFRPRPPAAGFRLGNLICSRERLRSDTFDPKMQRKSWMSADLQKIGFGGGCHWCTEAVFASLRGVIRVEQGFIGSDAPDDEFSEGVLLTFQPEKISLGSLIEIHLRTHSSTSNHAMRQKYRSAVYVMDEAQAEAARRVLAEVEPSFDAPLVTRVLPFRTFNASEERFQRYAEKNAGGPFCTTYIDPKLALLRKQFSSLLKPAESGF
jgi:peptide-methionine (S)-S-oxide reductase